MNSEDEQIRNDQLNNLTEFCLIDVGSTTTKAILFIKESDWKYYRQEAPTTVEKPFEDVTFGVINALQALEKETDHELLKDNSPCIPCFSTSSAGGGLAIVVAGLVAEVTAKSAERVALGAGAIVQDVIALNDDRTPYRKIEALKTLRPDMVLLAGGYDNGTVHGPVYLAELLNQSGLRPKLREKEKLPVIFAGNERAREYVEEQLADNFIYHPVPNLRPSDYRENLDPAREAIHDVFMDHVMSRAPGYNKYKTWISAPILPTPAAVSRILELASKDLDKKILAVDIGGATTDVFTADRGKVVRTVSANLGMSYSILNVIKQAGIDSIMDLLSLEINEEEVWDRIGNKYLRPTKLPDNQVDTIIECAAASLAIREAVKEHLSVLHGISLSMTEEEMSKSVIRRKKNQSKSSSHKQSFDYDLVIGSGGKLSHSPRRTAAMILIDALQPTGKLDLAVDSVFMFPHLGVLSLENPQLAVELFHRFGLVKLGTVVALKGSAKPGKREVKVVGSIAGSQEIDERVAHGTAKFIPIDLGADVDFTIKPGRLKLKEKKVTIAKDAHELIIDARGRPPVGKSDYFISIDNIPDKIDKTEGLGHRLYQGDIVETRELAVSGEVFVKPGEMVSPETIIAKSSRTFLRPFFLHIADILRIDPSDLPSCFNKKVGDEIEPGEIIARRKSGMVNVKDFVSPVSAVIEKILPTGTIIAREKADFAKKSYSVDFAKDLDLKPKKARLEVVVEVGQDIEKGQLLAGNPTKGLSKASRSPIRGKVTEIDLEECTISVEPLLEELELNAWLPGTVVSISNKGCVISNRGAIIQGIWGNGGQVFGPLSEDEGAQGEIVFRETINQSDIVRCQANKIKGLITGGLHLQDFDDLSPDFPIIITEGFGSLPMDEELMKVLHAQVGKTASIDAVTQMRAGVKRPRIILPDLEM